MVWGGLHGARLFVVFVGVSLRRFVSVFVDDGWVVWYDWGMDVTGFARGIFYWIGDGVVVSIICDPGVVHRKLAKAAVRAGASWFFHGTYLGASSRPAGHAEALRPPDVGGHSGFLNWEWA